MNTTEKRKPYWLVYYALPALFGILTIYLFISLFDKNMFCAGDGWLMQYTATDYARVFWNNVFHGSWTMVDFTLGEGFEPWIALTYYGLSDPMNIVFGLCSKETLPTVYAILTFLKLFLGGVAFGWYASKKSQDDKSIAMGALVYTFSGFFIFWIFCPGLMSLCYLFPILLVAMDKAFDEKKYAMLAGFTALSYITNYYAGFSCSLMLMVYALLRIIIDRKFDKATMLGYVKTVISHAVGIAISAFVILPVFGAMMGGVRSNSAGYSDSMLWFNWEYYLDLLISMFTPFTHASNYWVAPYKATPHFIFLAVPALLLFIPHKTKGNKNETLLKWSLILSAVFLTVPLFSKLFNMWMYPTHRWMFAFAMVMGMIVVWAIPKFHTMSWKYKLAGAILILGSAVATFWNMYPLAASATMIAAVLSSLFLFIKPRRLTAYITACLCIPLFIFGTFVGNSFGAQFCFSDIVVREDSEIYAAVDLTDEELEDFIRVSITDNSTAPNVGLLLGYKTTTAAWNVMPSSITLYNQEQMFPNAEVSWWVDSWDDRTSPTILAGTKYFITNEAKQDVVPYGFEFYKTVEVQAPPKNPNQEAVPYHVYINTNNPGIGYMYENTLSYDTYHSLDIASKQLAALKYAITETSTNTAAQLTTFEVPFEMVADDGKLTLTTNIPDGYEVYVYTGEINQLINRNQVHVYGIDYWVSQQANVKANSNDNSDTTQNTGAELTPNYVNVTATDSDGTKVVKTMRTYRPNAHLSSDIPTRTLCIGHQLSGDVTVTLEYMPNILEVKDVKLYAVQTDEMNTATQQLKNNAWTNVQYGENWISGTMNATFDGTFQLAIPYNTGWRAYVDGQEVDTFTSGVKYIGIELSEGEHEIRFEHTIPLFTPGVVISCISVVALIAWSLYEYGVFTKKRKKV